MNAENPTRLQEKLARIKEMSRQPEQQLHDRQQESQRAANSRETEKRPGQKEVDKLPAQARAELEKARQVFQKHQGEAGKTPHVQTTGQDQQWTGNREHGKHLGNVIAPAPPGMEPSAAEQKPGQSVPEKSDGAAKDNRLGKSGEALRQAGVTGGRAANDIAPARETPPVPQKQARGHER